MSENKVDRGFEHRAREVFDADVESLDGHTRSRLARARKLALESAAPRRWIPWPISSQLAPAGALAAAVLAVILIARLGPGADPAAELTAFDDIDILLGEEEFDLLEDLEFYAWLEDQPEFDGLGDTGDDTG